MSETGKLIDPLISAAIEHVKLTCNDRSRKILAPTKKLSVDNKDAIADARHRLETLEAECPNRHERSNDVALKALAKAEAAEAALGNHRLDRMDTNIMSADKRLDAHDRIFWRMGAAGFSGAGIAGTLVALLSKYL